MNAAQQKYTVTEQELLSIVAVLKKYRTMLFGYPIVVYTDHKNLTFRGLQNDRTARWRLFVEEYSPTFNYYPGQLNQGADALSRLPLLNDMPVTELHEVLALTEEVSCPIDYQVLLRSQLHFLANRPKPDAWTQQRSFGSIKLWCSPVGKICVPPALQQPMVDWYHQMLQHPGEQRMYETLAMNFLWPGMRPQVIDCCRRCEHCQKQKRQRKQYGKIPYIDSIESTPWKVVAVDLIGPWKIPRSKEEWIGRRRRNAGKPIEKQEPEPTLLCLTIIDLATRWIEIVRIPSKDANAVSYTHLTLPTIYSV